MIKKTLTRLSLAIPALLAATQASAHPSGHAEFSVMQALSHMAASPYHTGIIVGIVIAVAFIIRKVSHAKPSE